MSESTFEFCRYKMANAGSSCGVDEVDLCGAAKSANDEIYALESELDSSCVVIINHGNLAIEVDLKVWSRLCYG